MCVTAHVHMTAVQCYSCLQHRPHIAASHRRHVAAVLLRGATAQDIVSYCKFEDSSVQMVQNCRVFASQRKAFARHRQWVGGKSQGCERQGPLCRKSLSMKFKEAINTVTLKFLD
jgi:hypothetical protein